MAPSWISRFRELQRGRFRLTGHSNACVKCASSPTLLHPDLLRWESISSSLKRSRCSKARFSTSMLSLQALWFMTRRSSSTTSKSKWHAPQLTLKLSGESISLASFLRRLEDAGGEFVSPAPLSPDAEKLDRNSAHSRYDRTHHLADD
jgi:hypothetical protein